MTGRKFAAAALAACLTFVLAACGGSVSSPAAESSGPAAENPGTAAPEVSPSEENTSQKEEDILIYAHVGDDVLKIVPEDNSSADDFIALLSERDIIIEMEDYGGFEKVGSLGQSLSTNDRRITTQPGDVILYQGSSVTIYYDTNTWSFTLLGRVQDPSQEELKDILGSGSVTVTFSLKENI